MTNEQKAKEIAEYLNQPNGSKSLLECHQAAMAMAQWKDEQFAKEKQQLIDKVCNLMQHWILEHDYVDIMELEDYIKQKIEEL